jgi:hypothetical protein
MELAIHPLTHTPSWRGGYLSTGQLYLYLTYEEEVVSFGVFYVALVYPRKAPTSMCTCRHYCVYCTLKNSLSK